MVAQTISVKNLDAEQGLSLSPLGELLVFPTDTVYGIGVRYDDLSGIEQLRKLKSRPSPQPFSLHLSATDQIKIFCTSLSHQQREWIELLLPGPYTLLLPAAGDAPQAATLDGKIGIRVPQGTVFPHIGKSLGPLLGTSVNRKGQDPLNEPESILKDFQNDIALLIISDEPLSEINSAVIDLCVDPPQALRGTLPNHLLG